MADGWAPPCSGNIGAELGRASDIRHSAASIPISGASLARWRPRTQPEEPIEKAFQLFPLVTEHDLTRGRHPA